MRIKCDGCGEQAEIETTGTVRRNGNKVVAVYCFLCWDLRFEGSNLKGRKKNSIACIHSQEIDTVTFTQDD